MRCRFWCPHSGLRLADEPNSFEDLDQRQRRRLLGYSALRPSAAIAVLLALYAVIPEAIGCSLGHRIGRGPDRPGAAPLLRGARDPPGRLPHFAAVEALALAFAVLIIVFAFTISRCREPIRAASRGAARSHRCDVLHRHGDKHGWIRRRHRKDRPRADPGQMVLDIALVVGAARVIVFAARVSRRRREPHPEPADE